MVHFLRTLDNTSIIECQTKWSTPQTQDLSSAVYLGNYSNLLVKMERVGNVYIDEFIEIMDNLNEIRGTWWERYEDTDLYKSIDEFIKEQYEFVVSKYDFLIYITD